MATRDAVDTVNKSQQTDIEQILQSCIHVYSGKGPAPVLDHAALDRFADNATKLLEAHGVPVQDVANYIVLPDGSRRHLVMAGEEDDGDYFVGGHVDNPCDDLPERGTLADDAIDRFGAQTFATLEALGVWVFEVENWHVFLPDGRRRILYQIGEQIGEQVDEGGGFLGPFAADGDDRRRH